MIKGGDDKDEDDEKVDGENMFASRHADET